MSTNQIQQALAAKESQSSAPPQPAPDQSAAPAQAAPAGDQGADKDSMPDEEVTAGQGVNLKRAYSQLNTKIIDLLDGLGIKRTATTPHVRGEQMHDHINAVSQAIANSGGVTKNFLAATHTEHSPTGGETVAFNADKLHQVIIPVKSEVAKAAIDSCKSLIAKCASLLPDDEPAIKVAKSQLKLLSAHTGQGMSAADLSAALISVPAPVIKLLARKHSFVKHGENHPLRTGPKEMQQDTQQ